MAISKNTAKHSKPSRHAPKKRLFLTGLTMGVADLVPGVSGGTIALLFGIYEELLKTIKLVTGRVPKLIARGKIQEAFSIIPFAFLLPLGSGMGLAVLGLAQVFSYLLDSQPVLVWAFFFGLVLSSALMISRRVTKWTSRRVMLLLLGFVATFIVVGLPALGGSDSPLALLATGAVAITAMILPGISGSLIMVLLGQYEIIIEAVAERDVATMSIFAIGAIVGLAVFVRLLTWLLHNYQLAVIAFLVGVMLGSLRRIWPWQEELAGGTITYSLPQAEPLLFAAVILMAMGFGIVFFLGRISDAEAHKEVVLK